MHARACVCVGGGGVQRYRGLHWEDWGLNFKVSCWPSDQSRLIRFCKHICSLTKTLSCPFASDMDCYGGIRCSLKFCTILYVISCPSPPCPAVVFVLSCAICAFSPPFRLPYKLVSMCILSSTIYAVLYPFRATTYLCARFPLLSGRYATYSNGYNSTSTTIKHFWKAVSTFTPSQRAALLRFITSTSRAPLGGFQHLQPPLTIHKVDCGASPLALLGAGKDVDRLPSASTCYNMLKLPNYRRASTLREKLLYAINSGAGFELS